MTDNILTDDQLRRRPAVAAEAGYSALDPDLPHSHPKPRIGYLDGWRGLSILAVLAGHFAQLPIMNFGRFGVEMFFVLSGSLMAQVLFIERQPIGEFFRRRASRIWPAFLLFVVVVATVFHGNQYVSWRTLLGAFTFTINYLTLYPDQPEVLNHIWSLSIEEWSYVFLALIAIVSQRLKLDPILWLGIIAALATLNGVILSWQGLDYYHVYWRTDVRAATLLDSVVICLLFHRHRLSIHPYAPLAAAAVAFALNTNHVPDPIKYSVGPIFLSIALASLGSAPELVRNALSVRPLRLFGLISFSLYLWQQPFVSVVEAPAIVRVACAILIATLSYRYVENPLRRYLNSLGSKTGATGKRAPA
ncbi:peptidoglycan/LPS O-acetylase OafA/YrhL [Sphingomonas sp. PvP055]